VLAGLLEPGTDERIAVLLEGLGLRIWHHALARRLDGDRLAVLVGLEEFREHLGGELCVTLLSAIGTGVEVDRIDPALVEAAIDWLAAREK
jgi:3-dehydroquinate synthase